MHLTSIAEQMATFAVRHGLPSPCTSRDSDGGHVFVYSQDKTRRYAYSLTWEEELPHLLWVMLNPGTGETEGRRRNTFERCKKWSQTRGYGGLLFGNVFSERAKSAKDLAKLPQTVDPLNDEALSFLSQLAPETIVAWGHSGARSGKPSKVHSFLQNPKCFGYTKSGEPRHPLYVASNTELIIWPRSRPANSDA